MSRNGKVVVAMSGGVDSSVAAALLKEQGFECVGVLMRNGIEDAPAAGGKCNTKTCCSTSDAADARRVAAKLGIGFYVLDFEREFGAIINYFVGEYNRGRTPNPCVMCNQHLKFGKLFSYAEAVDAEFVATGHYARTSPSPLEGLPPPPLWGKVGEGGTNAACAAAARSEDVSHSPSHPPPYPSPTRGEGTNAESRTRGEPQLLRGRDAGKDQSYALFGVRRNLLSRMLLPVGGYEKTEIRAIARTLGMGVADKPDSQEICFVPDNDYVRLLREKTPDKLAPGTVTDTAGNPVGRHEGFQTVTIGQRKGLGLALGRPVYVTSVDPAANTIVVGDRDDLLSSRCTVSRVNWLIDPPTAPHPVTAQIRYNHDGTPATLHVTAADKVELALDPPASAVAPGQAAVFYDGDRVLGGGWIDAAGK